MKLTLPTMWSLVVASFTVASVWANASLESFEMTTEVDPSSSPRHLSGRASSCTGHVSGWELIDTTTNSKVVDLVNGTIVYSDNPSFSIRAMVNGSGTRSVSLTLNSGYTNTENTEPYSLCTNWGDTYRRCDGLTHGQHAVTGAACCDLDGGGTCQLPLTVLAFEIHKAPVPSYDIQLELPGITRAADRTIFASAAAKWQSIITGDLEGFDISCFPPREDDCQWPSFVDDIFMCADYQAIDGKSGTLAMAGPEYVRLPSWLPVSGAMTFDIADVARLQRNGGGQFLSVILHEMGHILGTWQFVSSGRVSRVSLLQCLLY
jgi:hypothetical protein